MKRLLIINIIDLPIANTNKYIKDIITGLLYINEIYTLEEIKEIHKDNLNRLHEVNTLEELCIT